MNTQSVKLPFLLPAVAVIAVILLGVSVGARITGLVPSWVGGFGSIRPIEVFSSASATSIAEPLHMDLSQAPGNARNKWRCPECGVIVSMRRILANGTTGIAGEQGPSNDSGEGEPAMSFEFTVRLPGGSQRMITVADPASWRLGERVIVIDGTNLLEP